MHALLNGLYCGYQRESQFPIKCCLIVFVFFQEKNVLLVNSEDTDQMPHFVAPDLGLHCLSLSPKNDARLTWANAYSCVFHLDVNLPTLY